MSIKGFFVLHANRPYMRDTIMLEMMDKSEDKVESHAKFAELLNTEGAYSPVAFIYNVASIDETFGLTNHIERSWTEINRSKVAELEKGSGKRSTSVGDIVIDGKKEKIFVVSNFGFTELNNDDVNVKDMIQKLSSHAKNERPGWSHDFN